MSRYRRAQVPGATYLFTVNLLNQRSDLLVRHVDLLRETERGSLEVTRGKGFAVFHPTSGNVDASAVWAIEMA
ncbi:hypothetical protein PstZobell_05213 [Stutzerimonas stutzeri ATCC 14405 = CCUG 16156]|nr:hypothetical protein PstZobell_05213 [Stutzerimonas stutzeri ATCC 14405 = CCUG 16156]